jgi:ABC-type multidrug transport system ATPase subunit
VRLRGIRFRYPRSGFELGPVETEGPDDRPWLILGGTGSGKTTLLRLLGGSMRPLSGEVTPSLVTAETAYLPQLPERVLGGRNLAEDLSGSMRPPREQRVQLRAALAEAGLEGVPLSRRSRELSQGERRRVALALLILSGRRHWALDEPEAGLDAGARGRLMDVLRARLQGGDGALWVASHHFEIFAALEPWVLVLEEGKLIATGNLRDVMDLAAVRQALATDSRAPGRLWRKLRDSQGSSGEIPLPGPCPKEAEFAQIHALLMDRSGL